jgi:hypothetical protein
MPEPNGPLSGPFAFLPACAARQQRIASENSYCPVLHQTLCPTSTDNLPTKLNNSRMSLEGNDFHSAFYSKRKT